MDDLSILRMKPLALALALALGLAGNAHASSAPQDIGIPSDVLAAALAKRIATAVTPELYVSEIGDTYFESRHLELKDNGYTVQSGALLSRRGEGEVGALVLVEAPDGALTAILSQAGKSGLLQVSTDGKRTFQPDAKFDFMQPDTVSPKDDEQQATSAPAPGPNEDVVVDALVGFTQQALEQFNIADPVAYALSQMETVNLSLHNSRVDNIRLNLAGIRVYAESIPTSGAGLGRWEELLTPLRSLYKHDINVGYSGDGSSWGVAYIPGHTSVNHIQITTAFKHEMGHNVGGGHCNEGTDNYRFGYDAADAGNDIRTNLCGNSTYYYSNPDVTYHGRKMGDASTANMARLWREQAGRLAGYSPAHEGVRVMQVAGSSMLYLNLPDPGAKPYFVANDPAVGPTGPESTPPTSGTTLLSVPLTDPDGKPRTIVMRGFCLSQDTGIPMNSAQGCRRDDQAILGLLIFAHDNLGIPPGWYNGTLELTFKGAGPDKKILVSIAHKF